LWIIFPANRSTQICFRHAAIDSQRVLAWITRRDKR
jgi:hypothetical protein